MIADHPVIVDRVTARHNGSLRYFTGKACFNGHVTERYVSTGSCVVCVRGLNRRYVPNGAAVLMPLTQAERRGHCSEYGNLKIVPDQWYAQVDAIRKGKKFLFGSRQQLDRTKPLDELSVIFAPRPPIR